MRGLNVGVIGGERELVRRRCRQGRRTGREKGKRELWGDTGGYKGSEVKSKWDEGWVR